MRVVKVLADGDGEELGNAETLEDACRIGSAVRWYRVYDGGLMLYDSRTFVLTESWDRKRKRWVSDTGGAYGELPSEPVEW